jgi:hypothetical protein
MGLEKLGFPRILSSEMSLFNELRANFAETFIRAPYWGAIGNIPSKALVVLPMVQPCLFHQQI